MKSTQKYSLNAKRKQTFRNILTAKITNIIVNNDSLPKLGNTVIKGEDLPVFF